MRFIIILLESSKFASYFDNMKRILAPDYKPTPTDILSAYYGETSWTVDVKLPKAHLSYGVVIVSLGGKDPHSLFNLDSPLRLSKRNFPALRASLQLQHQQCSSSLSEAMMAQLKTMTPASTCSLCATLSTRPLRTVVASWSRYRSPTYLTRRSQRSTPRLLFLIMEV